MVNENILDIEIPNTYVRMLTRDFPDHAGLVQGTGIRAEELSIYQKSVTVKQHLRCIANALEMTVEPDWHLDWGKRMAGNFHGPLSLAILSAPSLGAGLDTLLKYIPSRIPYHSWRGVESDETYRCEVNELIDLGTTRDALIEVPLIVLQEYIRMFQPGDFEGAHVELRDSGQAHKKYFAQWFDMPVQLDCERNAVVIPRAWRQLRNMDFDESAWLSALKRVEAVYGTFDENDVVTLVRRYLIDCLDAVSMRPLPSAEEMASRLNISSRTLIRRLGEAELSYRHLLDEVLKKKALEMIGAADYRVHYIATRLGYSDAKSFRRAFKRWCGESPGEYRRKLNRT